VTTITFAPCARARCAGRTGHTLDIEEQLLLAEEGASMYRPPMNTGVQSFERMHRQHEREEAILRRQHHEHVAAERAKQREQRDASRHGAHRIRRPAAAIWALVATRR